MYSHNTSSSVVIGGNKPRGRPGHGVDLGISWVWHTSGCAGYFGHPFSKSETWDKAISLPSCIAVTKRYMSKILTTGKPPLNTPAGRGMTWSLRLREENQAANTKTSTTLDETITT